MDIKEEIERLQKEISKLPPIPKDADKRLDLLADLLAENFLKQLAAGTLPKPVKRAKQSVRK